MFWTPWAYQQLINGSRKNLKPENVLFEKSQIREGRAIVVMLQFYDGEFSTTEKGTLLTRQGSALVSVVCSLFTKRS